MILTEYDEQDAMNCFKEEGHIALIQPAYWPSDNSGRQCTSYRQSR